MEKMLELVKVKKIYKTKSGDTAALKEVSISFPKKGLVFITGKSGSGKTTMLNVIGGLDGIDGGSIILDGKEFKDFTAGDYNSYRNTFIGFIFQEYNLLSEYTVQKNLELATELQGGRTSKEEIDAILKIVDLEGLNYRKTNELSGGQKQRVAIARALIKNPKIIMADEPTGALDSVTGITVMNALKKLSQDKLVIVVSHDLELAEKYADRIIRLVDGNIVEDVIITEEEIKANIIDEEKATTVKLGADLEKHETELLLKSIREKKEIKFIDKLDVRKKSQTPPLETPKNVEPPKFIKSKMKTKSSMGLGFRALGVKPVRLAFTIFLAVIAFALFGLFDTIAAYDSSRAVANLLRTSEYKSLVISAEEKHQSGNLAVRVTEEDISELNKKTKYNFRPLYEINDKGASGVTERAEIKELNGNSGVTVVGSSYYYKYVDDFIEFSENEISGKTIDGNGFNYTIIHGEYPTLKPKAKDASGKEIDSIERYREVAISSYMAECFMHYLSQGPSSSTPQLGGKPIYKVTDLIGATFEMQNVSYDISFLKFRITGIIDCGEIPSKYEELQTAGVGQVKSSLKSSFDTFINSGAYLKLFVPKGYVKEWREFLDRSNTYFLGAENFEMAAGDIKSRTLSYYGKTAFYKVEDNDKITQTDGNPFSKIIYFDYEKTSTNANEVIIPASMIKEIYENKLKPLDGAPDSAVNGIGGHNGALNAAIKNLTSNASLEGKNESMKLLISSTLFDMPEGEFTKLTITLTNATTNEKRTKEYNIVGVYVDVNNDIGGDTVFKYNPLMFSNEGLKTLGVNPNQGQYARLISPNNTGLLATNALSDFIAGKDGGQYGWYKNTVLDNIEKNSQSLKEFSNLFLYISITLAVFSVFMLFNYISSSIVSKKQSIGVLRALGSNAKDIFTMFFTESTFISVINAVIASVVAYVGCIFVNMYIRNVMNFTMNFAIFGLRQIIIIFGISLLTGILSSLIPIIRICKEKPIELIRKD